MDFSFTEEQQMLSDMLAKFVERDYGFEMRRALSKTEKGFSEENWSVIAEMGLLGLLVPSEYGGLDGTEEDIFVVMEALGKGLVLEPFLSTAVIAAGLLKDAGSDDQKAKYLPEIVIGKARYALAAFEPNSRYDLNHVECSIAKVGSKYVINGKKIAVFDGESADTLIVSVRSSGSTDARDGLAIVLIDAESDGVVVRSFPGIDGSRIAEVEFADVYIDETSLVGGVTNGYQILEKTVDRIVAALAAESIGVMERTLELTKNYLKERQQFGQSLANFQALQHKLANMVVAIEQARALAYASVAVLEDTDLVNVRKTISATKVMVGKACRYITQEAIQLHGGMGMTDEMAVGQYCKRLNTIRMSWGDVDHHIGLFLEVMQ